jgi:RES domain-containing protein
MPLAVYRVCRAAHARLDGLGARLAGGRWNSQGRAVVYMAESLALAVLENLVHMSRQDFPSGYVIVGAVIPDGLPILAEEQVRSAGGLQGAPSQAVGDYWFDQELSVALRVPSAVVPGERNYLLNPAHPEFGRIVAARPIPFDFDPRLFA